MLVSTRLKTVGGFTILEALIAFVVFALGALAIAGFLNRSLQMNADGEARTEALHLARETIADFRNFTSRAEVKAYATDTTGNTVVGNNATFTRTWTVADVAGNDNAILLTTTVAWTGVNGAQSVSLATEIAKLRPQVTGAYLVDASGPGVTSTATTTASTTTTTSSTGSITITISTTSTASTTSTVTSTTFTSIICSCEYHSPGTGVVSVSSIPPDAVCCTIDYCNANIPVGISNNTTFTVTCG